MTWADDSDNAQSLPMTGCRFAIVLVLRSLLHGCFTAVRTSQGTTGIYWLRHRENRDPHVTSPLWSQQNVVSGSSFIKAFRHVGLVCCLLLSCIQRFLTEFLPVLLQFLPKQHPLHSMMVCGDVQHMQLVSTC